MKGRKIRIRQRGEGLAACAGHGIIPLQWLEAGRLCTAESEQLVQFDAGRGYGQKGPSKSFFDTMRDEPVANAEFTLYQVAAMVDRGGYTVLELTGGFEGCGVQLKNLTAQQSKEASAALLEYQKANHISGDTKRLMQTESSAGQGCRPVCICWFRVRCRNTEPIRL